MPGYRGSVPTAPAPAGLFFLPHTATTRRLDRSPCLTRDFLTLFL